MFRTYAFRLSPTNEQSALLEQALGVCRLVYNLAWEQRQQHWRQFKRQTGKHISFPSQCRELTTLRGAFDWIEDVDRGAQEYALRDLDTAFRNFFDGRADYPNPRRKGVNNTFRYKGRDTAVRRLSTKWSAVWLPKVGWTKFRDTRPLRGSVKSAAISHDADGWRVSFACEIEHEPSPALLPTVGIDRGVARTLTLSTGEHLSLPGTLAALDRRRRKAQRELARKKRGSKRRIKALRRVARMSAKITRIRKDWHHRAALGLSQRFGAVVLEDLKIENMTASGPHKRGLNRVIRDQGWRVFENILAYKLEERGGMLVKVDPAYTSQTCSDCGVIDKESRESQASFRCRHCGFTAHADHNAAINILRRSTASMRAEGHPLRPVETRTTGGPTAENHALKAA